jgi:hypothetical protein
MKTKSFLTAVFIYTAFMLGGCVSSGQNMPGVPLEMIVVNKTGYTIVEIYCSPAFSNLRGAELLADNPLEDGQSRNLWFEPEISAAYWDILAVDVYGNEYAVTGISVNNKPIVTLSTTDDGDSETLDFNTFDDFSLDTF